MAPAAAWAANVFFSIFPVAAGVRADRTALMRLAPTPIQSISLCVARSVVQARQPLTHSPASHRGGRGRAIEKIVGARERRGGGGRRRRRRRRAPTGAAEEMGRRGRPQPRPGRLRGPARMSGLWLLLRLLAVARVAATAGSGSNVSPVRACVSCVRACGACVHVLGTPLTPLYVPSP